MGGRFATRAALALFCDVVDRLELAVNDAGDDLPAILAAGVPLVRELLAHDTFLREFCEGRQLANRAEMRGQSFRYCLYSSPNEAFAIHAGVFAPGARSSVHDHGTWGLVGVWQGEEREERFERVDDRRAAGLAELRLVRVAINTPGSVSLLVPEIDEIHRLHNVTAAPACSLHVYGRARRPGIAYDLATGRTGPAPEG